MATIAFYFLAFTLLCNLSSLPLLANAISNCGGSCTTLDDCAGQLICINGKCNDDPDTGTQICGGSASGGGGRGDDGSCKPFDTLTCSDGIPHDQYRCSPTITSSTQATLTVNDFSEGGDGGGPSKCDGKYHDVSEAVVALSTGWFNEEPWCEKMIKITATSNGKSTTAKVVDECDSVNGCDKEHDYQPPCKNNIVDGSQTVWDALGLNSDVGEEQVTWSMA